jgi:uncharacterized membrane-anchored protein
MDNISQANKETLFSKVPEVTLLFWIIKIAATTLGETGGDLLSMSLNLGYLVSTVILAGLFNIGAVLGDFLDKPLSHGGLGLSRYSASAVLLLFILICVFVSKQKNKFILH